MVDRRYSCTMERHPETLTVIFDGDCLLCRRSVHWLETRATHTNLEVVPANRPDMVAAYGHVPGYGDNMIVVADDGRTWIGPPDAYLVVMWAVRRMRALSYLLALPGLRQLTTRVFQYIAGNRYALNRVEDEYCPACATAQGF